LYTKEIFTSFVKSFDNLILYLILHTLIRNTSLIVNFEMQKVNLLLNV